MILVGVTCVQVNLVTYALGDYNTDNTYKYRMHSFAARSVYDLRYIFSFQRVTVEYYNGQEMAIFYTPASTETTEIERLVLDNICKDGIVQRYLEPPFILHHQQKNVQRTKISEVLSLLSDWGEDNVYTTRTFTVGVYGIPDIYNLFHSRWYKSMHPYVMHIGTYDQADFNVKIWVEDASLFELRLYASICLLGLLCYIFSAHIGRSRTMYICMCTVVGSICSVAVICLILFYLFSKQISIKSWITTTVLMSAFAYGLNSINNYEFIFLNYYFLGVVVLGGFIGFYFSYTKELTERQQDLMQIFFILFGIATVLYTVQLFEVSLLLLFVFSKIGLYLLSIVWRIVRYNIINKIYKPKRKMLTVAEYEAEGIEYTKKELENLIEIYRRTPSKLSVLSEVSLKYIKEMVNGKHHLQVIMDNIETTTKTTLPVSL